MFTLYEDPQRGVKTVGWFDANGQITVQVRQYVPDSFFAEVKRQREMLVDATKSTQNHWQPLMALPQALENKLLVDGQGRPLAFNDPEREKRLKKIANDSDYRDLRLSEGRV